MRVSFILIFLFQILNLTAGDSSSHYFVAFKDKNGSVFSVDRPWEFLSVKSIDRRSKYGIPIDQSDIPVNTNYIEALKIYRDIRVIQASKWLNGVEIVVSDKSSILQLDALNFIQSITFLGTIEHRDRIDIKPINSLYKERCIELKNKKQLYKDSAIQFTDYGKSIDHLGQIGLPYLHQKNLKGQGVHIAVFDAGFNEAYQVEGMEDLLDESTIIKDFVDYDNSVWEDDAHGARVLSLMKTFNPEKYIGSAPFAEYTLIRTEIGSQEYPLEELKWVFGAEFADSLGIDLIIGSLGYHTFDDPKLNHQYFELDGKTTIVARGANFAHSKGIAVICSAGNEGKSKWRKIGTPADAYGSIAIGACNSNGYYVEFSSTGLNTNKPNFIASGYQVMIASPNGFYKGNGTSYATPIFAGAFACLMQAFPLHSSDSLKTFLEFSASNSAHIDTLIGYGVADYGLAYNFISNTPIEQDLLWEHSINNVFGDFLIILKSSKHQKVNIVLKAKRDKKSKKLISKTIELEKEEWLKMDMSEDLGIIEKKIKKYKDVKSIELTIETESATYLRSFKLGN